MTSVNKLSTYLEYLCEGLGHVNRHQPLINYCSALMLSLERKSVEPMAAAVDPHNVRSQHQSLHHFVADSKWSDRTLLDKCWAWVESRLGADEARYWIVDDTGIPKKGKHSAGVSHQYCGQLGKSANCQVAVSLSIATEKASLPVDYRLYLPEVWIEDSERRRSVGIPDGIHFLTKPEIALAQIVAAYKRDVVPGIVLADAGYGNNTAFREGLDALGLQYIVGVNPSTSIWAPGVKPLPPEPKASGTRGRAPTRHRFAKGHEPQSCEQVALSVDEHEWEFVEWREGTNETLSGWFTALRVRAAHRDHLKSVLRDEQWLLVEWPDDEEAPTKYSLSTLPATASLQELVYNVKMRWRIERDYQELKDELGLNHYEGRNWRGFHHHASLCIAAYAFLVAERLAAPVGRKKNTVQRKEPALPEDYIPRGSPQSTTSHG
jgi:SRSO17 transposase